MDFQYLYLLNQSTEWFFSHGLRIILILCFALLLAQFSKTAISKIAAHLVKNSFVVGKLAPSLEEKRVKTLKKAFDSIFQTLIWLLAILTILPEFGVNVNPILTGLGIGGLIIGIGSRNVIQDYLAGFLIIVEDQFRVGEKVKVSDVEGIVQNFNLRRTIIKDSKGFFTYVPNSLITRVTNFSRKSLKEITQPQKQ